MPSATRQVIKTQQIQWLNDLYPDFGKVAQAIIVESVTVAEEAVSNAIEIVLKSIETGNTAKTKAQFAAYCRTVVRGCAMKTYSTYTGDVRSDAAAHRAAWIMRPDRRHTAVPDQDSFDGENDLYVRGETVGPTENEE